MIRAHGCLKQFPQQSPLIMPLEASNGHCQTRASFEKLTFINNNADDNDDMKLNETILNCIISPDASLDDPRAKKTDDNNPSDVINSSSKSNNLVAYASVSLFVLSRT